MIWSALARFFAFVFATAFGRWTAKRAGAREAIQEVKDLDRGKADAIRDRVDAVRRGGGMHTLDPDDTRGYRD